MALCTTSDSDGTGLRMGNGLPMNKCPDKQKQNIFRGHIRSMNVQIQVNS